MGVSTSAESAVFTAVYGGPRDVVTDTDVVVAIRVTVAVQVLTRLLSSPHGFVQIMAYFTNYEPKAGPNIRSTANLYTYVQY